MLEKQVYKAKNQKGRRHKPHRGHLPHNTMITDLFGKKRWKVNLHTHTNVSDGKLSPSEALNRYREKGYDAVALTDHWEFGKAYTENGITVLSGAEYNCGADPRTGVYHIVGVGMTDEPTWDSETRRNPQVIIDTIHANGGIAILAHPAWSLNTLDQIRPLQNIDATEIYNTVSGVHMSRRPDSSLIIDMLACEGIVYPLIADDDAHYYDGDECRSWIMVEAEDSSHEALLDAIRNQCFYATQGPEIHAWREGDEIVVRCSPCKEIVFLSNLPWTPRVFEKESITEARYEIRPRECFVRVEVCDADGNRAWSNIIPIPDEKPPLEEKG